MGVSMKTILFILTLSTFSSVSFAGELIDCSRTKRNMEVLCGDFLAERCELFTDCFIRKDSCGKDGAPKNAGECNELNDCHKALNEQYPQRFEETSACEYNWHVDGDDESKNKCRVKLRFGLNEMVCPGHFAVGNAILNTIDPDVDSQTMIDSSFDESYRCSHLRGDYKAKVIRCERVRERFKNDCMVADSEEDKAAYEKAKPRVCGYYDKFDHYAKKKTMPLNVRIDSVNDGSRGARDEVDTEDSGSSQQGPSARSR
jgi:hypothetical protein